MAFPTCFLHRYSCFASGKNLKMFRAQDTSGLQLAHPSRAGRGVAPVADLGGEIAMEFPQQTHGCACMCLKMGYTF